jgi:hypothetical protein
MSLGKRTLLWNPVCGVYDRKNMLIFVFKIFKRWLIRSEIMIAGKYFKLLLTGTV